MPMIHSLKDAANNGREANRDEDKSELAKQSAKDELTHLESQPPMYILTSYSSHILISRPNQ
jgi:hypothetical protein